MQKPLVLTIAGSDPSGGAGIQADIRAFESQGVFGLSVITAITVQTAEKVVRWEALSKTLVHDQLFTLLQTYPIQYVKCGMLPTQEIMDEIIAAKTQYKFKLVVDPILISGSGTPLMNSDVISYFIQKILPIVDVLTPNANEAKMLTGESISKMDSIRTILEKLHQMGPSTIILKGGHIHPDHSEIIDYIYYNGGIEAFTRERLIGFERIHGTGCIFSSIFLAQWSLTTDIYDAMFNTEQQIDTLFKDIFSVPTTKNSNPTKNNVLDFGLTQDRINILNEVAAVYNFIHIQKDYCELIPEVRTNISIGLPNPKTVQDIAAIEGRITVINNLPQATGPIKFGVSNHTARLLLTANKKDSAIRAVMNVKYDPSYIQPLIDAGLCLFEIRRENQPEEVRNKEKSTMQWVVENSYMMINRIPDIIWDCGEPEKEPMLRLFAKDGSDLIEKLKVILRTVRSLNQK